MEYMDNLNYIFVSYDTAGMNDDMFCKKVSDKMEEGYIPVGSLFSLGNDLILHQAMYKNQSKPELVINNSNGITKGDEMDRVYITPSILAETNQLLNIGMVGTDGYTDETRRAKFEEKKCHVCGREFDKKGAWYIPSFTNCMDDIYYCCPECKRKLRVEVKKAEKESDRLRKIYHSLKDEFEELQEKSTCRVFTDENGDLYVNQDYDECITLKEYTAEINDYLKHKDEIESLRAKLKNKWEELKIAENNLYSVKHPSTQGFRIGV